MKKWIKNNTYFFVQLCITVFFLLLLIVDLIIETNVGASEWWTRNVFWGYQKVFGTINRWFNFSITEVLIILFVVALLVLLIMGIVRLCQKRWKPALHLLMFIPLLAMIVSAWYVGTAGIAYHREEIPFVFYDEELSEDAMKDIIRYYADDYNKISEELDFDDDGNLIMPYTFSELNDLLIDEYLQYSTSYLSPEIYDLKKMVIPWFFSEIGTTGMYFSITTESIVNTWMPNAGLPFTMLHELSHSRGCMRESDAQLMATFVAIQSDNIYVRFSGYHETMYTMYNLAYAIDPAFYTELINNRTTQIISCNRYDSSFWNEYTLFDDISDWFYNIYLNLFSGTDKSDYSDPGAVVSPSPDNPSEKTITLSTYQNIYVSKYYGCLSID